MNKEAGNGRADIIMKHNRPGLPDIVIEFKKIKSKTDRRNPAEGNRRSNQTDQEQRIPYGLGKDRILYGIRFNSKKPKVVLDKTFDFIC